VLYDQGGRRVYSRERPISVALNITKNLMKFFEGEKDSCLLDMFSTMTPHAYFPNVGAQFSLMATHNLNTDYDQEAEEGY